MKKNQIILLIIIILIVGSIYYLEKGKVNPPSLDEIDELQNSPSSEKKNGANLPPMPEIKKQEKPVFKDGRWPLAPELVGLTGYINTEEGIQISDFEGKVVLVDFWTYSCINCIRTLPHLTAWHEKYADKGLVIIGVHTPEFEFEKDRNNVINAMNKHGVEYTVVQDNNYATWRNYKNRFWPRKYLIDTDGYIRYDHIGEGAYADTEKKIQELLAEIDPEVLNEGLTGIEDKTPTTKTTHELYAGYDFALPRGQNIGNEGGLKPGQIVDYVFSEIIYDRIYLFGLWKSNKDDLEAKNSGNIFLGFTASSVNIVADSIVTSTIIEVRIDGKYITKDQAGDDVQFSDGKAFIIVDEARLYNIFNSEHGTYLLDLAVEEGFTFNEFTFG